MVEVVSKKSLKKDYKDLLEIYARLGVEEYVAIRPTGLYADGPFEVRAWRRDPKARRLRRIDPDPEGRLRSRTTGLLLDTGAHGWGFRIWDAATGERLRAPEAEEARARRSAEERAEQEAQARRAAEERAERAVEARRAAEDGQRQAEKRSRELEAEIERLRGRGRAR